ncbi:CRISPR-associated endoribonuclease Cas2 [bacterium HR36]|nr:CRISPR-associated endoribonuclease Cas2 [bacterium HR36]
MYVILVYDVAQERVVKVCQFLRRYLSWVQNSAFEGELSELQLQRVKLGLLDLIDQEQDSVYLYILPNARWLQKDILGQSKGDTTNVI